MPSEALRPVRNRRTLNVLGSIGLAALLLCLTACAGFSTGSSSSSGAPGNPQLTGNLAAAYVGTAYNGTITVSGGTAPYTFSLSAGSLPAGLTLASSTGTISGTPTKTGVSAFTVQVADANNLTGSNAFQITVAAPGSIVVTVNPSTATVASSTTMQFTAVVTNTSNTSVTWSASPGTISSTGLYQAPSVTTNTSATIKATSTAGSGAWGTAAVTVTPSQGTNVTITTTSLSAATAGTAYSNTLHASGGTTPYTWSLTSGTLPSGFSLPSSGVLAGTTSQTGQFNFTVQVADSSSTKKTATQSLALTVNSSTGNGNTAPPTLFGFTTTNTASNNYPTVSYGMQRFWDSPPLQWPSINTASGVFDFSNLDSTLAQAYSNGVMVGLYTLARTPPWATSNPSDTTCHYTTATSGGGNGECDAPMDLNADGTGPNAIWKAWITAIAGHVNSPSYLQTHAHIKYWEIWNEPDAQWYWNGTFAQLARLTEDANCIITGRGVIHESGNGTATKCTATAIDPTAQIVMASGHASAPLEISYAQNQLYCNDSPMGYQLPCPNPGNAVAAAIDIVNFHMKPGNETGDTCPPPTACTPESAMQMYLTNIHGLLQPAELAKPLWDGEASYSITGFTGAYTDADMEASFMPRFYLVDWSLGISGIAWYDWTYLTTLPTGVQTSYQQTYNWLAGSKLTTPCAPTGNIWSCTITRSGAQYQIMWDASQSCANGSCTSSSQTVGSQWSTYQDMTTASTPISITGRLVQLGIKPVVLH